MKSSLPVADDFSLISWRPVNDAKHAWVALLVVPQPGTSCAALARQLHATDAQSATANLTCILPLNAEDLRDDALAQGLAGHLDAVRTILLLPLASCRAPDAEARLDKLRQSGFRLMVDESSALGETLPASIVALAVNARLAEPLSAARRRLDGPYLAFGVDSAVDFTACQTAGYTWFAGAYPLHPAVRTPAQSHGPSRTLLLKLLALVTSDAEAHAIEELLKQAPELSYQLLKLVNSVSFSPNKRIANFSHAIAMLGRRQLQRWLQLLLYAQQRSDVANPLLPRAALRASLCEALCRAQGGDQTAQENAFMAGMFSLLDVLLGLPLAEILAPLNLAEEHIQALLQRSGPLGALLQLAERAEQAPTAEFAAQLAAAGITPEAFCGLQLRALGWTIQVNQGA